MNVNVSIKEYIAGNYDLFQCLSITVSTDRDSNVRLNVSQQPVRGSVFKSLTIYTLISSETGDNKQKMIKHCGCK